MNQSEIFWNRYTALCRSKGYHHNSQDTANILHVTKGTITSWKTRGTMPKGETLAYMAEWLGTTSDYLLGLTDDPSRPGSTPSQDQLSRIPTWIRYYCALDDTDRLRVMAYMEGMLEREKYRAEEA